MSSIATFSGLALLCDADGTIVRVARDGLRCAQRVRAGSALGDLVDPGARDRLELFLSELRARHAAQDWEIPVKLGQESVLLKFAGGRAEDAYFILASVAPPAAGQLEQQLMEINNEQANALRAMAKRLAVSKRSGLEEDSMVYEQLGRLNNELTNAQRELSKKNAELELYRRAAEQEQALARELMSRMVGVDALRDPLLCSWIQPAHNLSGDLIAAGRTPGGALNLLLADGTGHGLAASLCVLPMAEPFYTMTAKGMRVGEIAAEINRKLLSWLTPGRFVAAALVSFDGKAQLEVWCGGLPAPFLLDAQGELLFEFSSRHLPFGISRPAEFDSSTESWQLEQPGQLVVCSDGVTEAAGANGELFGRERLLGSLRSVPPLARLDQLKRDLAEHLAGRPAQDDLSVAFIDCPRSEPLPSTATP